MSYRSKYTGVEVEAALDKAKTAVLPDALDKKQDVIKDLDNIRSNASKGSTAVQPEELASVATSGSYNDLKNKPYIPNEVTEQTVGDWGYTKNKGDYSKPSTGIPKSDLSYNVQQSLNKADSALQYHQDISHLATKKSLESKVDKVSGKQLSTEDFTTALKNKLNKLSNYDDTTINNTINKLRSDFDTLVSGDTTAAIKTFNEVIAFLDGISDSEDLDSIIASIEQQIATKYSKPNNGIPKSDLANNIQLSLDKADTALQEHQDIAHLATKDELNTKLDTIEDLTAIREGAALGATALQEETYKGTISAVDTEDSLDEPLNGVFETLPNGNIKLTINGVSKDFMPSTPSGDPQHYVYESYGAIYNDGDDYITETEWKDLVDDVEYNAAYGLNLVTGTKVKTIAYNGVDYDIYEQGHYWRGNALKVWVVGVKSSNGTLVYDDTKVVHRKGYWLLNSLGDLTNRDMRHIVCAGIRYLANRYSFAYLSTKYSIYKSRTNLASYGNSNDIKVTHLTGTFFHNYTDVSNCYINTSNTVTLNVGYNFVSGCTRHIIGNFLKAASSNANIFFSNNYLSTVKLKDNNTNFYLNLPNISKKSVLRAIETEAATTAITISLNSSAFNRISNEPDILEALSNHPNVTLVTV